MSNDQIEKINSNINNAHSNSDEFYEKTNNGQFDIIRWTQCPSFYNSEDILKEKLFKTISFCRCSALMRFSTLYPQDNLASSQRNAFLSPQAFEINPLFRVIPSTIIQTVTNLFQRFYTIPDQVAVEIIDFINKNQSYIDLIGTVTFPAVFFYFLTTEFSEAGSIFIEHCLAITHDRFTSSLLASFFDCFPRFSETLWQTFQKNCAKKSVFSSFLVAIQKSFRQLTPHHSRLIKMLNENDPKYLSDFFFRQYFQPRAKMRYYATCGDKFLNRLFELSRILNYCSFNYGSPHQQILMNAILESQSESLSSQELSYVYDIQLPCVYSLLSGVEICILRDFLLVSSLFKFKGTLKDCQIPPSRAQSMLPGYVQFSAKPISLRVKGTPISIIFNNLTEAVNSEEENNFTNEESSNFERVWNQINAAAITNGLTVPRMINMKNPNSIEIQTIINSTTVKSPRFRSFMLKKLNEKKNSSEKMFEIFIGRLQTERELARILEDFKRDSQMCMWKNAQEFVLEKCVSQENLSSAIVNEDEEKYVSNSLKFMTFRYKENVSCQQFYFAQIQQQQQQQKKQKNDQENKEQLFQSHPLYFDSSCALRSNICNYCSFYSNELNESSENLNKISEIKENKKSGKIMKMKAEKFEELLNVINYKENIAQFNFHFALAILNEWPIESEGMIEIRRKFAIFSDKRRCFLVENDKNVSMISQNKFVLKVFKRMQNLRDLKLGNQISELVKIIWQLKLVYDKFFKDFESVKNFEEFACNCFFFAGVDELIVSFIWFTRLASNFGHFIEAISPEVIEVFIAVTCKMFDIVKKEDNHLSLKLNISVIKVPTCS